MAKWICKNGHENESIANTYPTECVVCGAHYEDGGKWVDPVFRYADLAVSPVWHAYPEREPDRRYVFGGDILRAGEYVRPIDPEVYEIMSGEYEPPVDERAQRLRDELEQASQYSSLEFWLEIAIRAFLRYLERTPPGKRIHKTSQDLSGS